MRAFIVLAERLEQIARDHSDVLSDQEARDLMSAMIFLKEVWDAADLVDRYTGGAKSGLDEMQKYVSRI